MKVNREALRAIREKDGHSQASLARASGVAQSHISLIEKSAEAAANVRPDTVKRLAQTLGVPMSALLVAEAPV